VEKKIGYDPIIFAYVIYASVTIASAVFMIVLACQNITENISRFNSTNGM